MGESIEVSAKTVDDAVQKALQQLGLTRAEVEVEIIHPGSPGRILGFGAEPARVRVTATGVAEEDEEEEDEEEAQPVPAPRQAPSFLGRPPRIAERQGLGAAAEDEEETDEDEAAEAETGDHAADADLGRIMLAELLNRMGLGDARVEVVGTDPIQLNIRGSEVADLIGRRGENLRALQFVLGLMLNKQLHRHVRVTVDVDGYRARREDLLRGMAQRFAHRVRSTREAMQLEAMPPNERRIIHMALSEDPDVMTESVGEGDARRVVIKPRR